MRNMKLYVLLFIIETSLITYPVIADDTKKEEDNELPASSDNPQYLSVNENLNVPSEEIKDDKEVTAPEDYDRILDFENYILSKLQEVEEEEEDESGLDEAKSTIPPTMISPVSDWDRDKPKKNDAKKKNVPWELLLNLPYQHPEKELFWKDLEDLPAPPLGGELSEHVRSSKQSERELTHQEFKGIQLYEKALSILNFSRDHKSEAFALLVGASSYGHMEAKILVAWAKLFGDTLKQNIDEAKVLFHELSNEGYPEGHMGLGFLHSIGLGTNASQAKALIYYTIAATDGNDWAQMALGYRYWAGLSVYPNCEKALDYYQMVSDKVASGVQLSGGTIVQRVRLMEEVDNPGYNSGIIDNDLIEYYQLLAAKGDVQSQVGLGQLHYQGGRGVVRDPQKAYNYFNQAAQAGNPVAMAFLGRIYLEGNGVVKPSNSTAYKYFKKAADMGNPVGQSGLGMMYLHGRGVERDYNKAQKFFSQASDQGWVDGQLQLGIMHYSGLGVKRDYKLANNYFTYASQSGHVLAFYNLAQMHASGIGIMPSCHTAVELYKNVAERGKWGEKLMEAHMLYKKGRYKEAYVLYALLAELGYEVAQSNAAYMLDKGDLITDLPQDEAYVRALMFWNRAAAQGFSAAQVKIGDYYYYGHGVNVDYEVAAMHYKNAYDQQHNAQAMFNLGYMYEQGLGMKQDMNLAKRCYDTAADASTDAKVPVTLALMKLSVIIALKYLQENHWQEWFFILNLDKSLGANWDFYLMTLLVGFLGFVVYFRRPQQFLR